MPKRKDKDEEENQKEEEVIAEDWCFTCKDGGELLLCDHRKCFKAYHPECVGKDDSVLTSNERWTCKWHSCLICKKASKFHCYCCPNAVCSRCTSGARFVRVNEKYGFCNDCLKLALLVEENMDVDSEGESVDLKDRETYEGLFKEYYEIIKEKERFDADTVRKAKSELDNDESDKFLSDFDEAKEGEEEVHFSSGSDENPHDSGGQKLGQRRKKLKVKKTNSHKKKKSKKMVFDSWGSEALMRFLKLADVDTEEELSLDDVERIVLKYAKENKLYHPTKKRKVICDTKLQSILRRKEVNKNSIPKLLECHFAKNQEESEDDEVWEDIDDGDEKTMVTCEVERKQKSDNEKQKSDNEKQNSDNEKQKSDNEKRKSDNEKQKSGKGILKKEGLVNIPESRYAAIIPENIKLVYLKRSLVHELCNQSQAFENKVVGSFVRVKSNPNDIRHGSLYQLEQVTGIRSGSVAEKNTEVMLRVSNMPNDICLSMLSDGDFSEEECQDLLQKVKAGLLKKPILVELQEKAISLHEDITKHWIPREVARLQNLINLANEKGWRRELFEYLNRKRTLEKPLEVSKILQKFPVVIPDTEVPDNPPDNINSERKENGTSQQSPSIVPKELQKQPHNFASVDQLEENGKPNQQSDKKQIQQQTDVNLENEEIRKQVMANLNHKQTMAEVIEVGADEKLKGLRKKQNQNVKVKLETEKSQKLET